MPLSTMTTQELTTAINSLPPVPTIIRSTGLFKPQPLTTKTAKVEVRGSKLTLVPAVPRGTPGEPVADGDVVSKTFEALHLPKDDVVHADDVQDVRDFTTKNKALTVNKVVNDKLQRMRRDIDYTREHLQLGALQGKLIDAKNNKVLIDILKEFGITQKTKEIALSSANTDVGMVFDDIISEQEDDIADMFNGFIVFASPEFMSKFVHHKSMKEIYKMYREASTYRDGKARNMFTHGNAEFMRYNHKFGSEADIKAGEAKLVPKGLADAFIEYFAPADMSDAVNTLALPYYASKEKMKHNKGWELHAQSNPLPLSLMPKSVITLKAT